MASRHFPACVGKPVLKNTLLKGDCAFLSLLSLTVISSPHTNAWQWGADAGKLATMPLRTETHAVPQIDMFMVRTRQTHGQVVWEKLASVFFP